jgi:hypothetical protein
MLTPTVTELRRAGWPSVTVTSPARSRAGRRGGSALHAKGICTDGIFCGAPPFPGGSRNLAGSESMAGDPAGTLR